MADKQEAFKDYTCIPNMLIFGYKELSFQEKWLFVCLKHMCGKEGTRHLSLRYISEQTGIAKSSLSKSPNSTGMIQHLHDAGLIHAEIKKHGEKGQPQYHISIVDIWELNQEYFQNRKCPKNGHLDTESVRKMDTLPSEVSEFRTEVSENWYNTNITDKTTEETNITNTTTGVSSEPPSITQSSFVVDAIASQPEPLKEKIVSSLSQGETPSQEPQETPDHADTEKEQDQVLQQRCKTLYADMVKHCGSAMPTRGQVINERKAVKYVCEHYADEQIQQALSYLQTKHWRWSKPENTYNLRAHVLQKEIGGVVKMLEEERHPAHASVTARPQGSSHPVLLDEERLKRNRENLQRKAEAAREKRLQAQTATL